MDDYRENQRDLRRSDAAFPNASSSSSVSALSDTEDAQDDAQIREMWRGIESLQRALGAVPDNNNEVGQSGDAQDQNGGSSSQDSSSLHAEDGPVIRRKPLPAQGEHAAVSNSHSNEIEIEIDVIPTEANESSNPIREAGPSRTTSEEGFKAETFKNGNFADPYTRISMWNPVWLQQWTAVALLVAFCLMIITLILLHHFSNVHNGLSAQVTANHYSWTYGPTASWCAKSSYSCFT
jgi:hypothetical protein